MLALAATAAQGDATNTSRQAFSTCLRDYMRTSLEQRMEPAAFEAAVPQQCADRGATFRAALVDRDARTGGGRARAEEDAQMTMDDMRAATVERYRDQLEASGPAPQTAAPAAAETPAPAETPEPAAPATPQ